jgi:hypothetical protein
MLLVSGWFADCHMLCTLCILRSTMQHPTADMLYSLVYYIHVHSCWNLLGMLCTLCSMGQHPEFDMLDTVYRLLAHTSLNMLGMLCTLSSRGGLGYPSMWGAGRACLGTWGVCKGVAYLGFLRLGLPALPGFSGFAGHSHATPQPLVSAGQLPHQSRLDAKQKTVRDAGTCFLSIIIRTLIIRTISIIIRTNINTN